MGGIVAAAITFGNKAPDTECKTGYVMVENVCVDMCEDIDCGIGGSCQEGKCTCDEGFNNIENVCFNICEEINCGIGGNCFDGNCTCLTGYANVENSCEETCVLSPCKEMIKES